MVSKASDDFPDPESPVKTISFSRGSSRVRSLRLCSRAPLMSIESVDKVGRLVRVSYDIVILNESEHVFEVEALAGVPIWPALRSRE